MKLLLLVQTEQDVAHLAPAAQAILNSSITGVWVVFSPAITVNASEAAAKLDAEIAGLKKAEGDAAGREDYAAAAGYKTQREGKLLDRAKEIVDAHKKVSAEDRQARTKVIFGPFMELLRPAGLNVRVTAHADHYDRAQWVAMLNSLSGVWFKEFLPGGFVVGWPESVETIIKAKPSVDPTVGVAGPSKADEQRFREQAQAAQPPKAMTRREELEATHHMSLRPIAKKLGIDPAGLKPDELVTAILAAEAAPAPEPVESY